MASGCKTGVANQARLGVSLLGACLLLACSPGVSAQETPIPAAPGTVTQGKPSAKKASETNVPTLTSAPQGTTAQGSKATTAAPMPEAPSIPKVPGETLDQVVAIVNGNLVLDSDVDEERRFEQFQPYLAPQGGYTRDRAIERLINRDLILQQAELQPGADVSEDEVTKQIAELRKQIPACGQFHCETEEGWKRYLAEHGFDPGTFTLRWKQRMQVLAFVEARFRSGVNITPAEIKSYYEKTFLPEYAKQGTPPPPTLDSISSRIQGILLQQQVSALLADWLRSLRAQGGVVVLHPGEEAP